MKKTWSKFWHKGGPPAAAVLLFLVVWQVYTEVSGIEPWILPSPLSIFTETVRIFPELVNHTASTIKVAVIGYSIAAAFGIVFSILLRAVFPALKRPLYPLLIISQCIPTIVLAPLFVSWFGYGWPPKIIIITLVCFFPIMISALQGYENADPAMRNYMLMIGASRRQVFRKLEWPSALPYLFSGLRVSTTYSVMAAIIAEWLGTKEGLGLAMRIYESAFRRDRVLACVLIIIAFSLIFVGLIAGLEKMVMRWRPARKEDL